MVRENRRVSALTRKLLRDFRQNGTQFLAMLLLCFLGTWVFAGLDANWRMEQLTFDSWIEDGRLADFWVRSTSFSRQDIARIRALPEIDLVQERITLEADAPDLPGKVSVALHAFRGEPRLNVPLVRSGKILSGEDPRGCLVEEQFAQAQGLVPGSRLELEIAGRRRSLIVRGTVLSPEYLITVKDMSPDPSTFGFILLQDKALEEMPYNELILRLRPGSDPDEAEAAIESVLPSATIIVREKTHSSTLQARNYVSLFRNMSYLFPVLAYFVAALVVVTTLARMMDTQRIQMGTMKALGYPDGRIYRHYVNYALWPSALGSFLGLFTAQFTLPPILWRMLAVNMRVPQVRMAPISPLSWGLAVAEVLMCVLICVRHIRRSAQESTADLLRPKPPRSGSRVPLDRIGWLWGRLSFNTKMIIRNLFRNKGRTLMSMVGLLFCNMLIICSFGLQDSIPYFVRQHFFETLSYDVRADMIPERAGTLESYRARLDAARVDGVMEMSVTLTTEKRKRTLLLTVLPEDTTLLRLGSGASVLALPEDGIVLTEKMADLLSCSTGDWVTLRLPGDDETVVLRVAALAQSNIGQGAYMGKKAWERLHKGAFFLTGLLIQDPTPFCLSRLEDMDEVSGLKYPEKQYPQALRILDSASAAFSILSFVALGLAFVICYNMGLMNFTERTREYATLKVLGYHQREIRGLMMRENNLTAVFGVAAGILPGIGLVRVILKMCEFESMVFVMHIHPRTILLSSAVTYAFAALIEWFLTLKVRKIDMVEALKSVE